MNIEDNKLIAEFMGELTVPSQGIYLIPNTMCLIYNEHLIELQFTAKELKYDTSWSWLMPVVDEYYNKLIDINIKEEDEWRMKLHEQLLDANIKGLYNVIVSFIKFYNNHNVVKSWDQRIEELVEDGIDDIFCEAHQMANTKTGDITPSQMGTLNKIKGDLENLIKEQLKQNL